MNIIFLSKRRPQNRDLFARPYGRFFYLPYELAGKGHQVHLVLLNYKNEDEFYHLKDNVHWHSINILPDPFKYFRYVNALSKKTNANFIVGFSDIIFGVCAVKVANLNQIDSLIDAYDNYESYMPWFKPLHWLWRYSLKKSSLITAAGPQLLEKMTSHYYREANTKRVIEMAADPVFKPRIKKSSRKKLGIPVDKFVIGYSGSLSNERDTSTLVAAFSYLSRKYEQMCFVFSGRNINNTDLSSIRHVMTLGYVDDNMVPDVLASFDLLVAVNKPDAFGNYSYPVKLYEALSMGIPVLASRTLSTEYVLRDYPDMLFSAGNSDALIKKIEEIMTNMPEISRCPQGWNFQSEQMEELLTSLMDEKIKGSDCL